MVSFHENVIRVAIVGSRRRSSDRDRQIVRDIISSALRRYGDVTVVSGACPKGADLFAAQAAREMGVRLLEFPVPRGMRGDRSTFTMGAFTRNRTIVENSDVVFALVHPDRTGGTENTVGHALDLGVPVFLVDGEGLTSRP